MTSTLRQKINEYAGKVPYVGKALTTEIKGTRILAGVLAAGMMYSAVAKAEPYVDTRSSLIKKVEGQVCLDTDQIQFHSNSNVYNNVLGRVPFFHYLARALVRRGYDVSEGRPLRGYRYDGKPVLFNDESDWKIPHLIVNAFVDTRSEYLLELIVLDENARTVFLDQVVFPISREWPRFDGQKNLRLLETIIPPSSCAALRDGRVKPSVPLTPETKDCVCPPPPACGAQK